MTNAERTDISTTAVDENHAMELRGITAGYGRTTVLREVSIAVPRGRVVALLGPNGAGKTTTLRVASGLIGPRSGRVLIDGQQVTKDGPARRARAGACLIPEGRGVFRNLSVRENLRLQQPPWQDADRTELTISAFPILGERMNQLAGSLSGGQQQMLAVARAFLADPKVVLLDEVSMGLAPKIIDQIYEGLAQLSDSGTSLLIVEQYVHRALAMADDVVLLNRGVVSYSGPATEVDENTIMHSYLHHDTATA